MENNVAARVGKRGADGYTRKRFGADQHALAERKERVESRTLNDKKDTYFKATGSKETGVQSINCSTSFRAEVAWAFQMGKQSVAAEMTIMVLGGTWWHACVEIQIGRDVR